MSETDWLKELSNEDIVFMKNFIVASGSLKEMAKTYEVSYPTVRIRLDRLIEKVKLSDKKENSSLIRYIRELTIDEKIAIEDAQEIIRIYNKEEGNKNE
ncbi:DUF2089 family protein [Brochothrix campestris]|uniref:DUF2089 domain-containing protein n=1 Tax=Brochothrix campestris FSL F6-1037 TaxID=1265861 RepID=W7CJ03_9LIST|nr:DUF2089 family protein [Brochothrix campestris]EUJ39334.1 hypothetical protein BCAMP_07325 [Brochothrix campestris FSL F6-1037]